MKNITGKILFLTVAVVLWVTACNDGLSSSREGGEKAEKRDKSQRTVIDSSDYVDFTVEKHDARAARKDEMVYALSGATYKNGNSSIKINAKEGTVELLSDSGRYNGKDNCQVYAVFGFDIQAASGDCLYLRKDQKRDGFVMIDGMMFRNDAVPDLAACLPLYGYSRNRIEVSSVMDGHIVMPSGTYWKN